MIQFYTDNLIIHPYNSLIPDPDNKVQHSFYKLHIVRDHEQKQSEMTDHNKDKPYLFYDYLDLVGLIP